MATDSANRVDTFTIALTDSVDLSHAPIPENDSEQILFRQLFPTLIRVDCRGRVQPGLATGWERDSVGQTWIFSIPEDALFPDGSSLTASAVSASWFGRWPVLQRLGLDTLAVLDQQHLAVTMSSPTDSLPHIFADPGTGVIPENLPPDRGPFLLGSRSDWPVVEMEVVNSSDLRDALDGGADLLVSRDPALIDYAESRPEFETFPLPWDRTYLLLQQRGAAPLAVSIQSDSIRRSLAYDAVRSEARPAQLPIRWHGPCALVGSMHDASPKTARLVYPRRDAVARQLAERITAIAGDTLELRAVGLDTRSYAAALQEGRDRGYIISVELRSLSTCVDTPAGPGGARVEPLIDTRPHAVVRRGSPPLSVDWDGTIRVLSP